MYSMVQKDFIERNTKKKVELPPSKVLPLLLQATVLQLLANDDRSRYLSINLH